MNTFMSQAKRRSAAATSQNAVGAGDQNESPLCPEALAIGNNRADRKLLAHRQPSSGFGSPKMGSYGKAMSAYLSSKSVALTSITFLAAILPVNCG